VARKGGYRLVENVFAQDPINKLYVEVAEGSTEDHAIATIGAGRQPDDKDLLKLR
jgi:hypothetical protein